MLFGYFSIDIEDTRIDYICHCRSLFNFFSVCKQFVSIIDTLVFFIDTTLK